MEKHDAHFDWAFSQRWHGVIVVTKGNVVTVLEFNEFLGRISSGIVVAEDRVVSSVFTNGIRRRAGDLRLFAMVRSGQVSTEDLPRRVPGGVLATGLKARRLLEAVEGRRESDPEFETLLRPAVDRSPSERPDEMLHIVTDAPAAPGTKTEEASSPRSNGL